MALLPSRGVLGGVSSNFAASRVSRYFEAAAHEGEAEAALAEVLAPGPQGWLEFDSAIRNWTRSRHHGTDLARAGAPIPETPLGIALTLASGDGFRRAEVLQHPRVSEHPVLYPLVLFRAVDHVPQIRALANALLPRLIAASDHETFAAMLTVAYRLQHRAHAAPTSDLLLTALGASTGDDLLAILARSDGRSARWAGQALISGRRLREPQLAMIATGRFDDRLQERCADALAEHALAHHDPDLLRPLLRADSARVRTSALTGLVRLDQFDGVEVFLTDRSAAVRATAQWGLRRAGQDPAARYRELLQSPRPSPRRSTTSSAGNSKH